jgi:hypothetical protein
MSEEENVTETENPAEEVKAEAVVEAVETEAKEENKPKKPWYQKRIDRFTAQNQQLSRTNEQLMQRLANKAEDGSATNLNDAELQRIIEQKALEIVETREFNNKCNAVYEDGNEEFDDFQDALKELGEAKMMTKPFLDIVTDLDEGHKILYHLGKNPEEIERIQSLTPTKQALALAKIQAELEKPVEKKKADKKVSSAPEPIKPIESKSGRNDSAYGTKYYEGMPQDEFEAWDDKQSRKRG